MRHGCQPIADPQLFLCWVVAQPFWHLHRCACAGKQPINAVFPCDALPFGHVVVDQQRLVLHVRGRGELHGQVCLAEVLDGCGVALLNVLHRDAHKAFFIAKKAAAIQPLPRLWFADHGGVGCCVNALRALPDELFNLSRRQYEARRGFADPVLYHPHDWRGLVQVVE